MRDSLKGFETKTDWGICVYLFWPVTLKFSIPPQSVYSSAPVSAQVVKLGSTPVVEALLEAGADLNIRDPVFSLSVTHDAAREGFVDTVRALIHHGADVNVLDARGNLPLHLAAEEGHLEVVKLVTELTANPQASNDLGYTAGQLAHSHKKKDTAEYIDTYLSSRE